MREQRKRSIAKTISWRVVATVSNFFVVLVFTGELALSIGVGAATAIVNIIFYYAHERIWNKMTWGLNNVRENLGKG